MAKQNILVQFSGSIACYKTCSLISKLVQNGFDVQTTATDSALQFIGTATLEGLTGHPVRTNVFQAGQMMDHINLVKWADLIILCPASANSINRLSQGLADDWIGSIFLANNFRKPYWIAPAMNTQMYHHPATQASLKILKEWGATIFDTATGQLACGDMGEGKLIDPEIIYDRIYKYFKSSP